MQIKLTIEGDFAELEPVLRFLADSMPHVQVRMDSLKVNPANVERLNDAVFQEMREQALQGKPPPRRQGNP